MSGILLCANSYSDLTSNLYAYYKLNDGIGTTPADSSGNGLTGSFYIHAPTWITTGSPNTYLWSNSLGFNAASVQGVNTPINSFNPTTFTVSAWVNGNNFFAGYNSRIIASDDAGSGPNNGFSLNFYNNAGGIGFVVGNGNYGYCAAQSSSSVAAGSFNHIAGVWNGANNTALLYFNGVLSNSNTQPAIMTGGMPNGRSNVSIGYEPFNGVNGMYGYMNEIRIYTCAFSAAQIYALYQSNTMIY